jgi:hypothetical protein
MSNLLVLDAAGNQKELKATGDGSAGDPFVVEHAFAEFPAAAALADNFANPTASQVGAFCMVWDGSAWDRWAGAVTVTSGTVTVGAALPAGTNNIGDVDVLTLPALPAGTNAIGTVGITAATTDTPANVSASASSVTLAAANASRKRLQVFNDSSAALYLKHGSGASATSFTVKVAAGGYYEMPQPVYPGIVTGIWDSATGAARVTEAV